MIEIKNGYTGMVIFTHDGDSLTRANLTRADLTRADLTGANLRGADLRGADLDYSCLPLWCGGRFKADTRICKQIVAHALAIVEESGIRGRSAMRREMATFIRGWHRGNEFKTITKPNGKVSQS